MPFDAVGSRLSMSLKDSLDVLRVQPVPLEYLRAHKEMQLRKHPAHCLLRKRTYLGLFAAFTVTLTSSTIWTGSFGFSSSLHNIITAFLVSLAAYTTVVSISGLCGIKFRQQAFWRELSINRDHFEWLVTSEKVPASILKVAREVERVCEQATMIYGELIQEEVVLDPYLVVQCDGEHACLGIWEGETIIAAAQRQK